MEFLENPQVSRLASRTGFLLMLGDVGLKGVQRVGGLFGFPSLLKQTCQGMKRCGFC